MNEMNWKFQLWIKLLNSMYDQLLQIDKTLINYPWVYCNVPNVTFNVETIQVWKK